MYEFQDPAARDVVAHVLDTHPEGQSLLAEAGHWRSLAAQSLRATAEAFARMKAARLRYEALRRHVDPRYGRTMHFGVAVVLMAAVAAALMALDVIELSGVLFGWIVAAAAAAATAAWAGCAWLAARAVREERHGRVAAIAAGVAAAGLLLAALHAEASSIGRFPGWHRSEVAVLMMLFIFALVSVATEVITRTEPASLPRARRHWHRSWEQYVAAGRLHRADAEAAAVAMQEWCSLVDGEATVHAAGRAAPDDHAPGGPPTGNGHFTPDPWPGQPPM